MDPGVSAFLSRFEAKIEAAIDGLTKAQQSTTTKIDDLLSWRPDLERRVADLGDAVTALQQAQAPPQRRSDADPVPQGAGAPIKPQGPDGHCDSQIQWGPPAAYLPPPPPLPANATNSDPVTPPLLSPFSHAN